MNRKPRINTRKYEYTHGRKPKGFGYWMFLLDGDYHASATGTLLEAIDIIVKRHEDVKVIEVLP